MGQAVDPGVRRWGGRLSLLLSVALTVLIGVTASGGSQDPEDEDEPAKAVEADKAKGKGGNPARKKGGLRVPVGAAPKGREAAPDPLAPAEPAGPPVWPFHYSMKLAGDDGQPIVIDYYPAQEPFLAPVVMLVHESGAGRSRQDFEEAIEDLKGKSLVRHLQEQGYAVLTLNLRGHGPAGARRDPTPNDARMALSDLQTAYRFLVDRHNRGELNLGKFGVVGVGDTANLVVGWAAAPGGAVSGEGRLSDIGALVLVSPRAEAFGVSLARILPTIASRFPMGTLCGDKDEASLAAVRDNQQVLERQRQSRVTYYDTSLHGGKLLVFFPKVATDLLQFLDEPVNFKKVEWEPRYLLAPVAYDAVKLEADSGFAPPPEAPGRARGDAPAKDAAAPKAPPAKKAR